MPGEACTLPEVGSGRYQHPTDVDTAVGVDGRQVGDMEDFKAASSAGADIAREVAPDWTKQSKMLDSESTFLLSVSRQIYVLFVAYAYIQT